MGVAEIPYKVVVATSSSTRASPSGAGSTRASGCRSPRRRVGSTKTVFGVTFFRLAGPELDCVVADVGNPGPETKYSTSSAFGCRWMSCFAPGGKKVTPKTVLVEPTVSLVTSHRTSMSTQPRSGMPGSGAVAATTTLYGCSATPICSSDRREQCPL